MPFSVPSLDDLRTQVRAALTARLAAVVPGYVFPVRRSVIGVLADVWAAGVYLAYRALGWLARQLFLNTAEGAYLQQRAAWYAIVPESAATAAGNVVFTGGIGLPVPLGTVVQTSDASVSYATQAAATVGSGGTVSVAVLAQVAGAAGNQNAGAALQLATAVAGILPTVAVDTGGIAGGLDVESDASLLARTLARIQQPPQGGAASDYIAWAKQVAGVTRAWCYPLGRGPGTVDVYFTMDGRSSNIPLTADIAAVQAVISAARPVTADAQVWHPTADALAINIHGLYPSDAATKAAITAQLAALARTIAPGNATVGDGISNASPAGVLYLSQIEAAITAAGGAIFDLTAPAADVIFATGHLPATPTVTFV